MADHDPDPDRTAAEVSLAADGDSSTEDMPTIGGGNPTPMEDMGYNENIPVDVVSTLTPERSQLVQECPALVCMVTDYNYDDSSEADGDEAPRLENPQLAQDFPTPGHLAQTGQVTIESKESWVLSLYDGIGCLAHGIKDEFSSMGYTKYIALESDPRLRTISYDANPRSQVDYQVDDNTIFPGIQYGLNYKIDSPHEVMLKHVEKFPRNSIKLFVSNTADRPSYLGETQHTRLDDTSTMKIWDWVKARMKTASS